MKGGWIQLGLFIDRNLPIQEKPKVKRSKKASKSKPIRKEQPKKRYAKLAPGELDDDINF